MKTRAVPLIAAVLFLCVTAAFGRDIPALKTDQSGYLPGETVTFTGSHWAPGERVRIAMIDEATNEERSVEAVADSSGSFTVSMTMPDGKALPRYIATAAGSTSRGVVHTEFSETQPQTDGAKHLDREGYWFHRLTYPTGLFNPEWLRRAINQDSLIPRNIPLGSKTGFGLSASTKSANLTASPLALSDTGFTSLGPKPLRMTGCSGCFNYTSTTGRINTIAIDPVTPNVAYAGSVGGGVWKTTNCCSNATAWTVTTDDPAVSTTSIGTIVIDPNNHNVIYAGTGDLNYGSFSMGSQGILKSTDAGASWTVLAADVFGAALPIPAGQFPQYQAVGKVRVDPRNSNNVLAGAKTGLYLSYDGGVNWTGPCRTNNFTTQRQDITGLEVVNTGTSTRVIAAVGVRGFATTVQYDLGSNGANGLYAATLPAEGCPSFTAIAGNANGFVFGTSVTGSAYATGANLNAGSGIAYGGLNVGNQLGRVDIAVAPSNPNVIYAQVQSIAPNSNSGCGNTAGCQLGVWATTNGGQSWSFMAGSAGGALRNCSGGQGDYPQNWYDQAVAVDPNNPDRLFISTFDVWFATRTGTAFNNLTCGYSYSGSAGPVHVDQHALAFRAGSSSVLLLGHDGGVSGTSNANAASASADPTWFDMNSGLNTIEFYSGDISGMFANSAAPQANGGAQDNGSSSITFSGSPTGPVQWQMGKGGDGFYGRIDPVSGHFWQGNNSGHLHRCVSNCTASGASWTDLTGSWTGDTQSFILPYDIFKGTPGSPLTDCSSASCNHMIAGTVRVWETIAANVTPAWYVNSPANLTKATLGNRSFINQLAYSPATSSVAIVGTNDGNVQIGRNLGTGSNQAIWVNVTGNNTVLPNRPILDVALDPRSTIAPIGYAAVGGFDANTPSTPGHVFRVVCNTNCASFTWTDKSGNLPDMPVDSIIANPNFPQQVFAGTDIGLYYTDDITANPPVWYRFQNGLPNTMIWDMQIDRGATTLSLWTRSRGAYVWPLSHGPENPLPTALAVAAASGPYGGKTNLSATLTSGGNPVSGKSVSFTLNGNGAGSAITGSDGVATIAEASLQSVNAGTYPGGVGASLQGDSSYAASNGSNTLTVEKATVTPAILAADKVYDGTTTANLSSQSLSGVIGTDDVTLTVGSADFADKHAGPSKAVTASGLGLAGSSAANYQLSGTTASSSAAITPRPLAVTAAASDKPYDGTPSATVSLSDDRLAGDSLDLTYASASFTDKNAGTGKTVTVGGIALSGTDSSNYAAPSSVTATASIRPRSLTVTADADDKSYDGTTSATAVLSDDRLAGDSIDVTYASAAFADKHAGSSKSVTVSGITLSGSDAGNYSANMTASATAAIAQRPLLITTSAADKEYDGTTAASVTLSDNRVPGDFLTLTASAAFADKNAGTAKPVHITGIAISGADAANYSYASTATSTANILKAPLTVTAASASRLYGYPNPAFTASYSGFQGGEALPTSDLTGAPALATAATQASAVGAYPITVTQGTLSSNNYTFTFRDGSLRVYLSSMIGLDSVSVGSSGATCDSFDSAGGYEGTKGSNAAILSNGSIEIKGGKIFGTVVSSKGSVLLGSGSVVTGDVTAGTSVSSQGTVGGITTANQPGAAIVAPAVANCGAHTPTGSWITGNYTYVNGDLTVNGMVYLANGTYCFRSVKVTSQSSLRVAGPVVMKLTGTFDASGGSVINATSIPSNLQIMSSYAGKDGVWITGGTQAFLTMYAPTTDVTITGSSPLFGAVLGQTLKVTGSSQIHYDTQLFGF